MGLVLQEKDYLEHFGIKGMKWGVRRERRANGRVGRGAANAAKFNAAKKGGINPGTVTAGAAARAGGTAIRNGAKSAMSRRKAAVAARNKANVSSAQTKMANDAAKQFKKLGAVNKEMRKNANEKDPKLGRKLANKAGKAVNTLVDINNDMAYANRHGSLIGKIVDNVRVRKEVAKRASKEIDAFENKYWSDTKTPQKQVSAEWAGIFEKHYATVAKEIIPKSPTGKYLVTAKSNSAHPERMPKLVIGMSDG